MTTTTNRNPVAAIAISNGRTKDQLPRYGDTYYMKDGQAFIIMLHNPTRQKIAARLLLNGKAEQSMIVLKPGQRAWLERFIDIDRKFVFETYEVDDTAESHDAIANNGKVRVEFYAEEIHMNTPVFVEQPVYIPVIRPVIVNPIIVHPNPWPYNNPHWYYNGTTNIGSVCYDSLSDNAGGMSVNSLKSPGVPIVEHDQSAVPQMETGRVEAGAVSNQKFHASFDSFNNYYFHVEEFRLMPEKYKPAEKIKLHCVKCGRAQKSGDIFCGTCGTKYE